MAEKIKINSYEQYWEILQGRKLYNNGFSKAEILKYIQDGRLFAFADEYTTVFAYDEQKYWHMVIPMDVKANRLRDIIKDFSCPVICYVVGQASGKEKTFEEFLLQGGFDRYLTIREYKLDNFEQIDETRELELDTVQDRDMEEILDLWLNNLPMVEIPFLSKRSINHWKDDGKLFCVKRNNHVIGACCYDAFLGKATVSHVVVAPDERGKGYAARLIYGCMADAKKKGMHNARAWIEERNAASQKCFMKIGFYMTSMMSKIYIFREDKGI